MAGKIPEVERRRAIRRRKSRRKHLLVAFIIFLLLALVIFAILSVTVLFPIKNVTAGGSAIYTDEEIVSAAKLKGKNIIAIGTNEAESNIRKSLPYVDSIKIERKLPDTVKVVVKDAKEYACYKIDLSYYIVSEKGYVLSKTVNPRENLIEIVTSGVKCKVSQKVMFSDENIENNTEMLLKALKEKKFIINKIDTSNRYSLSAVVNDKFEVNFGGAVDLDAKCNHLSSMLSEITEGKGGYIDLSGWSETNRQATFKKKSN